MGARLCLCSRQTSSRWLDNFINIIRYGEAVQSRFQPKGTNKAEALAWSKAYPCSQHDNREQPETAEGVEIVEAQEDSIAAFIRNHSRSYWQHRHTGCAVIRQAWLRRG